MRQYVDHVIILFQSTSAAIVPSHGSSKRETASQRVSEYSCPLSINRYGSVNAEYFRLMHWINQAIYTMALDRSRNPAGAWEPIIIGKL